MIDEEAFGRLEEKAKLAKVVVGIPKHLLSESLCKRICNILNIKVGGKNGWKDCVFRHVENLIESEVFSDKRFILFNKEGKIEAAYFPKLIADSILDKLMVGYDKLKDIPLVKNGESISSGTWNRYGSSIEKCKQLSQDENELLFRMVEPCIGMVMKMVRKFDKQFYNKLETLNSPLKQFGSYPTIVFNSLDSAKEYNKEVKPFKAHSDSNDYGLASLVYFGEFTGGELLIDISNTKFKIKPGDFVFLNAYKYKHSVEKITSGRRLGLVFFAGVDHFPIIGKSKTGELIRVPALEFEKKNVALSRKRSSVKDDKNNAKNQQLKQYSNSKVPKYE